MLKLILRIMSLLIPVFVALLYISLRIGQQNPSALIAFISERNRQPDIFLADSNSAINVVITESRVREEFVGWSADGRYLAFDTDNESERQLTVLDTSNWTMRVLEIEAYTTATWYSASTNELHFYRAPQEVVLVNIETGIERPFPQIQCPDCLDIRDIEAYDTVLNVVDGNLYVEIDKSRYPEGMQEPNPDLQPFTPDGQFFVFTSSLQGENDIYLSHVNGGLARRLTNSPTPESAPQVSADGTKISFVSFDDGNAEIVVLELASGYRYNISRDPGRDESPIWQRLP